MGKTSCSNQEAPVLTSAKDRQALNTPFHYPYEMESRRALKGCPLPACILCPQPAPELCTHFPLPSVIKAVLFAFQLAGSAVIAFGLWFRFGGTMKDLSSEDKSPEYFYIGE